MASFGDFSVRAFPALASERAAIGLGQGVVLWLLYSAAQSHAWPATQPYLFTALLFAALFIPLVAVLGLGNVRPLTLAAWLACALALVVVVGLHALARNQTGVAKPVDLDAVFDPASAVFALAAALFIAHSLVAAGDADRRPLAAYPTYFDTAWKHAVQLVLSLFFVGLFWGVLWLGTALFELIGLDALRRLIMQSAFAIPASTLAFAFALHVSDVQVGLVRGVRNLLHALLSWLLPLAAVLIVWFILSLPFTGLAPLWRTRRGSQIVLTAAAVLVVLINTAYGEGEGSARPALPRWAGTAASLCLPVLVAISAYGLALRVGQRGWTNDRIIAVAWLIVTGCYAAGYAWAAILSRPWLKRLEATNVIAAFAILAAIVALKTPLADPARLSVNDQLARLASGQVRPDRFDFTYLRFQTAGYGRAALARLTAATGPNAAAIRRYAERALAQGTAYTPPPPPSAAEIAGMTVFPRGQTLPRSLAQQNWSTDPQRYLLPTCLINAAIKCEAFVTRVGGGAAIVVAELTGIRRGVVLQQDAGGLWRPIGTLSGAMRCASVREALRAGSYRWVPPVQQDLEAAGERLAVTPFPPSSVPRCR